MADKYLIVVDVQKDFVSGTLGTKEAEGILPLVVKKVNEFEGKIYFTFDTHYENYLQTQEGKNLPVKHCIEGTDGWELAGELREIQKSRNLPKFIKNTFGSVELAEKMREIYNSEGIESIELVGLCTDICVVSNALLLKAYMPEVKICVDASCCAGVTPEKHKAALMTMESCQIIIKNM